MTDENLNGGDNSNGNGGENLNEKSELELKLEKLALELEQEKARAAGLDKKLSQEAKAKQEKELQSKTAEERAELLAKQVKALEQKEAFRQSFKEVGLDPDNFQEIVNETDPKLQAQKFAELLKAQTAKSAELALESYKKEILAKVPPEANPQGGGDTKTATEAAFLRGLGYTK